MASIVNVAGTVWSIGPRLKGDSSAAIVASLAQLSVCRVETRTWSSAIVMIGRSRDKDSGIIKTDKPVEWSTRMRYDEDQR